MGTLREIERSEYPLRGEDVLVRRLGTTYDIPVTAYLRQRLFDSPSPLADLCPRRRLGGRAEVRCRHPPRAGGVPAIKL